MPIPSSKGADGREVSLRVANNYIQWRYPDTEWTNLVPLSDLKGEPGTDGIDGREVHMRVVSDTLQWRLGDSGTWQTLMSLSTVTDGAAFGGMVVDKTLVLAEMEAGGGGGGTADAVTYTPQTLTEEQKPQARTNIGAYAKPASGIPKSDLEQSVQTSLDKADTAISPGLTAATPGQIIKVKAVQDGKPTEWEAVDMPGGGELILEYVHDESKFSPAYPAVYPIAYDADTKIWTSDGRLDLTTIAAAGETVSKFYQINIIEPLLQLSPNFDQKKWNPLSSFKLKVLSSNTFSTGDYVPPVIADDWSKYIMIANETVSINMPSNASDKIRMVFDGQFIGATRYATFGGFQWFEPNSNTTIVNEIGYQQRRGIYNHIVCDFDLENGKIYGTTSQTFVSYDKIGSAQGVYYPIDAVAWPQIVLNIYAYAGYNSMPYKGRLRIYNRG